MATTLELLTNTNNQITSLAGLVTLLIQTHVDDIANNEKITKDALEIKDQAVAEIKKAQDLQAQAQGIVTDNAAVNDIAAKMDATLTALIETASKAIPSQQPTTPPTQSPETPTQTNPQDTPTQNV